MEDIVGIRVYDGEKGERGFLTWGRVFDKINPRPLLTAVTPTMPRWGLHSVQYVEVCDTLQGVAHFRYFYEAFFKMCLQIPDLTNAKDGREWARVKRSEIRKGEAVYFLGNPSTDAQESNFRMKVVRAGKKLKVASWDNDVANRQG